MRLIKEDINNESEYVGAMQSQSSEITTVETINISRAKVDLTDLR